jgi:predicted metal-dependent peptidase
MKFNRVIGKIDDKLVYQAEDKLSQVFLELGTRYNNEHVGSGMGGDPLIFSLMYPVSHVCTLNMPTAATDGKFFYWNPKFVLKQSRIGLRFICGHESWHAIYMHPSRRGSRLPKLWNIAVDYIVNGNCMDDFKARKMNATEMFQKHLGKYMTLEQYADLLRDPFKQIKGFEELDPTSEDVLPPGLELPAPDEDRELTEKEIQELEKQEKKPKFYFVDPDLAEEMKRPEKIYDYLYALLPKCPKCGRIGMYQMPNKKKDKKKGNKKDKEDQSNQKEQGAKEPGQNPGDQPDNGHDHGDGQPCNCGDPHGQGQGDSNGQGQGDPNGQGQSCNGDGPCDQCGGGFDIFGFGNTLDDHMDTQESEEKLAKRIADAMESARKMAGHIPASLEDELGILTQPKIRWQDVIRSRFLKARAGNSRNDWTRFRSRPMFSGLLVPKKKTYQCNGGVLLDTSGSMSKDDMAFGVSQLQSLDDRSELTITCGDADIYWDDSIKIKKCSVEELKKIVPKGRGGTMFGQYFTDYEKKIGKCDFLVIITDGYLLDTDVANMVDPGIDVYWIITSDNSSFNAPFGKVYSLHL